MRQNLSYATLRLAEPSLGFNTVWTLEFLYFVEQIELSCIYHLLISQHSIVPVFLALFVPVQWMFHVLIGAWRAGVH